MVDEITVTLLSGVIGLAGVLAGVIASDYFTRSRAKEEKVEGID